MSSSLSPDEIRRIHADIVTEYASTGETEQGIRDDTQIDSVVELLSIQPDELRRSQMVARLIANLVSLHPFVDANKRTALNVAGVIYARDGYDLQVTKDTALILKTLGVNRDLIETEAFAEFLAMSADSMDSAASDQSVEELASWHRERYHDVYDWLETN